MKGANDSNVESLGPSLPNRHPPYMTALDQTKSAPFFAKKQHCTYTLVFS